MALARWTPMGHLPAFQEEMNRLFDEFFRGGTGGEQGWASGAWTPPVDIYEDGTDAVVLKAELPDMKREDIGVTFDNNVLTLKGERRIDEAVAREKYQRLERRYGSFSRSFTLPATVDAAQISATYKDGVLTIRLPKREEARPRQIAVSAD